uniref:Uncharacterized protein n=1 Tax=Anguilla anguilla TaxID=7936 RepID=A0A0E9RLY8_ANGAN
MTFSVCIFGQILCMSQFSSKTEDQVSSPCINFLMQNDPFLVNEIYRTSGYWVFESPLKFHS